MEEKSTLSFPLGPLLSPFFSYYSILTHTMSLTIAFFVSVLGVGLAHAEAPDPYLWLEDIHSPRSLEWVHKKNQETLSTFTSDPRYRKTESEIREILLAKDRIPAPRLSHGMIYNFWQDEGSVRGIWRRTPLKEYKKSNPRWETVLDLDLLAKTEKENWVWKGTDCLPPEENRCLITLSRGGKDAAVVREFDVEKKEFVAEGFFLPEAKSSVTWKDENTLWVGTDFGPGSLTQSGYPRWMKIWKRGTPLSKAELAFEGKDTDVGVFVAISFRPEGNVHLIIRVPSSFESEIWLWKGERASLYKIPLPRDASFAGIYHGWVLGRLRSDWKTSRNSFHQGSVVALPLSDLSEKKVEVVLEPTPAQSVQGLFDTKESLYVQIFDNVKSRVLSLRRDAEGRWSTPAAQLSGSWSYSALLCKCI